MTALARLVALGALCLALVAPARAGDDDLSENTIGGSNTPKLKTVTGAATDEEILAWQNRPFHQLSYNAAEALKVDVEMIDRCRAALELIYARDYKKAKSTLDELTTAYPTSGIGPTGEALLYQALMFENYDYRYEKQYELARDRARAQLSAGLAQPGGEAFELFLLAGVQGVDAIHAMRKGEYLPAITRALEATKNLNKSKEQAPTFADTALGDGLFLYWRTIVANQSKALPQFEDRRAEGLELMRKAEREAVFVGPGATLALAYSFIEERNLRLALDRCLYARKAYPQNVINNMTLGRVYTSMGRLTDALRVYDEIVATADNNQRVHYFRGIVLARMQRYAESEAAYTKYLGFPEVPTEARGQTYYRLGALYLRQKDYARAESHFKKAVETSGNEVAKKALQRLKKQQAGG